VNVAHQRHVELDDLRLEHGEARQPGVTRAQVVQSDAEPEVSQLGDSRLNVFDVIDRRALGDFEHDPPGHLRERCAGLVKRFVEQVPRVRWPQA